MTAYADLVAAKTTDGSIKQWVNNSFIPATTILTEAQAWIYQRLRVREMLTSTTGSLALAADTITLPTRYKAPKFLMFTANSTVAKSVPTYRPVDFVVTQFEYDGSGNRTTGRPNLWGADATNLQFEKKADQAYPYYLLYYQSLAALSGSSTTNFLTDSYPRLLRATCSFMGFEFLKDTDRQVYWLKVAMGEISDANVAGDLELSGAELQMEVEGDGYGG